MTHCRMGQFRETILKMEEWSTNFTVIKGSISMALLSLNVTRDSGMVLNQDATQKVRIFNLAMEITLA